MKSLKGYFITGLLVLVPFVATAAVIWHAFGFFDGWIKYFGINIPGAGIVVLITVLTLTGMLVRNYIGKQLHVFAEWLMLKVPLVNTVYSVAREVSKTLLNNDKSAFQAVVVLEFSGHRTIGFVTGDAPLPVGNVIYGEKHKGDQNADLNTMLNLIREPIKMVYVMQAFSPAAGFIMMVPESQLQKVDMTVEAAMKLVLTGGMVSGK